MLFTVLKKMKKEVSCFTMIAVLCFCAIVMAQDRPINEIVKTAKTEKLPATKKDISGVVVDMITGEPIAGVQVSLLNDTTTTDKNGRFTLKKVNVFHAIQMTARITTDLDVIIGCSYFSVPTNYYPISANKGNKIEIKIINMNEDGEISLRISDFAKNEVDKYCSTCHEASPCLIEEDYGRASSGRVNLKGVLVKQSRLEGYIKKMRTQKMTLERYKSIRYVDSHPKGMDMTKTDSFAEGRITIPEGLDLKDDKIISCDTCHSRHLPTDYGQFVLMDFMQRESICVKCHK